MILLPDLRMKFHVQPMIYLGLLQNLSNRALMVGYWQGLFWIVFLVGWELENSLFLLNTNSGIWSMKICIFPKHIKLQNFDESWLETLNFAFNPAGRSIFSKVQADASISNSLHLLSEILWLSRNFVFR